MATKPKEHTLYDPLIKGALADGWLMARISDQSFGKKPCDIIGTAPNGKGAIVEVKVVDKFPNNDSDFPWNQFESHQIQWLNACVRLNGYALMPLYNWRLEVMRVYRMKNAPPFCGYVQLLHRQSGAYTGWNDLMYL